MSDYAASLAEMAERIGGLHAVLVLERSGIEVASHGGRDAELPSAEFSELLARLSDLESVAAEGAVGSLILRCALGTWVLQPVAEEYVLALLADPEVPSGKLCFYAAQWAAEHGGEFV